jgi:hypothetical protein
MSSNDNGFRKSMRNWHGHVQVEHDPISELRFPAEFSGFSSVFAYSW